MSNPRVFIQGKEVEVPEGYAVELVRSGDASGGFEVCITCVEERPTSSVALPGVEKRTLYGRTYYNSNGDEVARVAGVDEWVTTLDKSALPFDYKVR